MTMKSSRAKKALKWAKSRGREGEEGEGTSSNTTLCQRVFGNDLLRDKILNYALHDNTGNISGSDARSCRLVEKQWLVASNKLLVKCGYPLLTFDLKGSTFGTQNFVKIYRRTFRWSRSATPLKIRVSFEYPNLRENTIALFKLLNRFRKAVVELELKFTHDQVPVQLEHPLEYLGPDNRMDLSALHTLTVTLPQCIGTGEIDSRDTTYDLCTAFTVPLILNSSQKLVSFSLRGCHKYERVLPRGFENLRLPGTLRKMEIQRGITTGHMHPFLGRNNPLNLTELSVTLPDHSSRESDLVYNMTLGVRNTLKVLKIYGKVGMESRFLPTTPLNLPEMKYLQEIFIRASYCEWKEGVTNLEKLLPALKKIDMRSVTSVQLRKWMGTSRFEKVEDVNVELAFGLYPSLSQDQAISLNLAFPNVTKLDLFTAIDLLEDGRALQHIFLTMVKLQSLTVRAKDYVEDRFWDSLLVGVPREMIATLENSCRGIWGAFQISHEQIPSIANLTELQELNLSFNCNYCGSPMVLSDVVFEFAFFKMPKLRQIKLDGQLEASPTMIEKWQNEGRLISSRVSLPDAHCYRIHEIAGPFRLNGMM